MKAYISPSDQSERYLAARCYSKEAVINTFMALAVSLRRPGAFTSPHKQQQQTPLDLTQISPVVIFCILDLVWSDLDQMFWYQCQVDSTSRGRVSGSVCFKVSLSKPTAFPLSCWLQRVGPTSRPGVAHSCCYVGPVCSGPDVLETIVATTDTWCSAQSYAAGQFPRIYVMEVTRHGRWMCYTEL